MSWMTMPPNTAQRAYGIGIGIAGTGSAIPAASRLHTKAITCGRSARRSSSRSTATSRSGGPSAPLITEALAAVVAPQDPLR